MNSASRIEQLQQMLAEDPKDVFLQYALGLEFSHTSTSYPQAILQFEKVLAMDENYLAAYYQLGQLLATQGLTAQALIYYKRGAEKARDAGNRKSVNEFEEAIFLLED